MMASKMKQKLGILRICHIQEYNKYVYDVINFRPYIRFIPPVGICNMELISMSDAYHGASDYAYGQNGNFTGLRIDSIGERKRI